MSDVAGAQTILLSNSNKKGTSILVSFQGDGSVSITTNGPVAIDGQSISINAKENVTINAGKDFILTAKQRIRITSQEDGAEIKTEKGINLIATTEDVVLDAKARKVKIDGKADVEITSKATARVTGSEVEFNKT